MSTTVYEALQNAQINFSNLERMGLKENQIFIIAKSQFDNAMTALENGLDLHEVIQESIFDDVKVTKDI